MSEWCDMAKLYQQPKHVVHWEIQRKESAPACDGSHVHTRLGEEANFELVYFQIEPNAHYTILVVVSRRRQILLVVERGVCEPRRWPTSSIWAKEKREVLRDMWDSGNTSEASLQGWLSLILGLWGASILDTAWDQEAFGYIGRSVVAEPSTNHHFD